MNYVFDHKLSELIWDDANHRLQIPFIAFMQHFRYSEIGTYLILSSLFDWLAWARSLIPMLTRRLADVRCLNQTHHPGVQAHFHWTRIWSSFLASSYRPTCLHARGQTFMGSLSFILLTLVSLLRAIFLTKFVIFGFTSLLTAISSLPFKVHPGFFLYCLEHCHQ